ncbi:MAG TPA: peptide ABC transporter substrate-binding protein, partial [Pyrinomonadaceae bacterium]|nr:peptide ABC transporter substrate-binding protein [Pyrinomonadaceae bacterium]
RMTRINHRSRFSVACSLLLILCLTHSGCFTSDEPSTYYGNVSAPRAQEFRWSDGGLPQTFDPAFAVAPPDTDAVRALFEGLTDYDPKTLAPVPAVATRWESSADGRVWTFYLRDNARWSNGERVTARDFVRSWERTLKIGPLAPHTELLSNIEGATITNGAPQPTPSEQPTAQPATVNPPFGARAVNDQVLEVTLEHADHSFPALVAHPVFRPVKVDRPDQTQRLNSHELISNGAFQLSATEADSVSLERAKTYWDDASVALDRVTFVNTENPEDALAAYRAGRIDAVTNAPFEPLALKLLAPYKDFRRSTFGALTFYAFNTSRAPFDDVRVREALALAIDRERVSRDDLGGATVPAGKFLPEAMSEEKPVVDEAELLEYDVNRAKTLLAEAGYPDGEGFPVITLLINRNDQQRVVAQSIAGMWRSTLNIETQILIKPWDEYEAAIKAGDYDIVRRGTVMQTTSELTNLRMLFDGEAPESEAQALKDLKAIPIYFASSYAIVKPYISGFEANVLDAPNLKSTRINTAWRP